MHSDSGYLRGVSQDTNNAWYHFVSLFRRDCANEGTLKSHELLPARLEFVNEQLFAISHSPGGTEEQVTLLISHPEQPSPSQDVTVVGSFHQVGLRSNTEPSEKNSFVKIEVPDDVQTHRYLGLDAPEHLPYPGRDWAENQLTFEQTTSEKGGRKRSRIDSSSSKDDLSYRSGVAESEDDSHCDHQRIPTQSISASTPSVGRKPKSLPKIKISKADMLQHWKQFEKREDAKFANLGIDYREEDYILELPSASFASLLATPEQTSLTAERTVSEEEAHSVVAFVTAVAGPESLIQFKQAMIGWRTRSSTMELMKANDFIPVLKALHHLEASNAFNAIATRIKLVQLAEAVDVANLTLPAPKGRGNPILIWLSNQYKIFLRAEYPELVEGSTSWNTKLDDIKRKVKTGRRWQQLIKLFGVGILVLVPSFASADTRNCDFNKTIKTYKDPCFKLIIETLESKKGHHVRQLSAKLHEFMNRLFSGQTNLPRLVLEYMDTSQIEAQPNCSPELGAYLDIATTVLSLPVVDPALVENDIDYGNLDLVKSALERLGLRQENLEEFKGNNKMSGAVVNSFMTMLTNEAKIRQENSLFLDSDFFPGANRCRNCRSQDHFCDMTDQEGAQCTRCRCDGVNCVRPKQNGKLNAGNFYLYDQIFIPIFTKEITHWSLVVIRPQEKSVVHYDSLEYPGPERPAILTWALREVVKWVRDFIIPTWEIDGWRDMSYAVAKQPPGGNDCGICTVMFCRLLQMGQPLPLTEQGTLAPRMMAQNRSQLAKQLIDGRFTCDMSLSEEL